MVERRTNLDHFSKQHFYRENHCNDNKNIFNAYEKASIVNN